MLRVRTFGFLLLLCTLMPAGWLTAAEPVFLRPVDDNLLERINQAESQLQSLRSELGQLRSGYTDTRDGQVVSASRNAADGDGNLGILDRVESLENKWTELHDSNGELHDKIGRMVKTGTSNSTVTLFGRVHADYWAFPGADAGAEALEGRNPEDRFIFRRARIGAKGEIGDNMLYKIAIEFAGGNKTQYRDLYLGFKDLPILQTLLIGNQKRPYGLDALNSSRFNVFMERPFVVEGFNQDARRLGVAAYGISDDLAWNWRYGVYNMELTQNDSGYVGDHYQLQVAGRLANTIWYDEASGGRGYAHWAISGTVADPDGNDGPNDGNQNEASFDTRPEARSARDWLNTGRIAGADTYELLGVEGVVNVGPVQVVGEVLNVWLNRNSGSDLHFWGGYAYASYFLTGEHMPWNRKTGTLGRPKPFENFFLVDRCDDCTGHGMGAWQIALRYSYADFNDNDISGGIGESLTFGLNWWWNSNARMQFNYVHGDIDNRSAGLAANTSGNYDIIGTRFMVDF